MLSASSVAMLFARMLALLCTREVSISWQRFECVARVRHRIPTTMKTVPSVYETCADRSARVVRWIDVVRSFPTSRMRAGSMIGQRQYRFFYLEKLS